MTISSLTPRHTLLLLAAILGFLNVLPLLLIYHIAGDFVLSYALIQCFGEQVWQGHFYPHWCMNANAGYGSPGPIFYMPLAFYATTPLYPLRYLGMEIQDIYFLCLWLVSAVTFVTATLWFESYAGRKRALWCAAAFLWLGYRMEVFGFRSAYAECWAIALLPLLFLHMRRLAAGQGRWPSLALVMALLILSHTPTALLALAACGLWLLMLRPRALPLFAGSALLALAVTAFHWQAMRLFGDTLHPVIGGVAFWRASWANAFADFFLLDIKHYVRPQFVASHVRLCILSMASIAVMLAFALWAFRAMGDTILRREARAWLIVMLWALFMMFSPSTPLWKLWVHIMPVETPWRMQFVILFGFAALLAMLAGDGWDRLRQSARRGVLALCALLMLCGAGMVNAQPAEGSLNPLSRPVFIYTQYLLRYFNTKWVGYKYLLPDHMAFYTPFVLNGAGERARFLDGTGQADILGWNYDGIIVATSRAKPGTLRIEHFYYPIWQARIDGEPATLRPEENEAGRMLVDIPAGEHRLSLTMDFMAALPPYYRFVCAVSWLGALGIASGVLWHRRRKNQE